MLARNLLDEPDEAPASGAPFVHAIANGGRTGEAGRRGWVGMRIGLKIFLVGAIPIAIAAFIALAAWMLLGEADRARQGAVLAGTFYRNLSLALAARDDYVKVPADERGLAHYHFASYSNQALYDVNALAGFIGDESQKQAIATTRDALSRFMRRMAEFVQATERNDMVARDMSERAASLIALTDQARARQHASNTDIIATLSDGDRKLRFSRDIVDKLQDFRGAIAAVELNALRPSPATGSDPQWQSNHVRLQFDQIAEDLTKLLEASGHSANAAELPKLAAAYTSSVQNGDMLGGPGRQLTDWMERLLKIHTTERRALHDEMAELLTYSVKASETDQATQNIAIETLKLGQATANALSTRDPAATSVILEQSNSLSHTVASLPISPLIQSEMIDAIDQWQNALSTTTSGLKVQSGMIADMDTSAGAMLAQARSLNDVFTSFADRIGNFVRQILIFGAAAGVLLGAVLAYYVARSITAPLLRLQGRMLELAEDPFAGPVTEDHRRDELGDMARAANFFLTEISHREQALRRAKERADATLADLRQTQDDLIQYEKLASLGQLVAGVAHEINTPVGIALTTATSMSDEVKHFDEAAASGKLLRSEFTRFVERINEGSQLLFANLTRAAELVQSFKQVAVDQASGERRTFELSSWLSELLTSLGPVLRRGGHEAHIECPEGLVMDTYPGALAQVITNLVTNAVTHAFDPNQQGRITLTVKPLRKGAIRIVFSDDGRGIPVENHEKVFEPFFTTGRSTGSTGLGLHIVYNLVANSLDGKIDIDSEPGHGTNFIIDLPLSADATLPQKHFATA